MFDRLSNEAPDVEFQFHGWILSRNISHSLVKLPPLGHSLCSRATVKMYVAVYAVSRPRPGIDTMLVDDYVTDDGIRRHFDVDRY